MKNTKENKLVDIHNINIDMSTPLKNRQRQFIKQIKDPYKFTCNGLVIEVEFSGEKTMEEKIVNSLIKNG